MDYTNTKFRLGDTVSWWIDREMREVEVGTIVKEPVTGQDITVQIQFSRTILTVPRSNIAPRD